jgi:hypothetical protein
MQIAINNMKDKIIIRLILVGLLFQVSKSIGQSSNSQVLGSSLTTEQVKFLEKNFCLVENGDIVYSKNDIILSFSKLKGSIYEVELNPKTKFKNLDLYLPENKKFKAQMTAEDDQTMIMTVPWKLKGKEYRSRFWLSKASSTSFSLDGVLSTATEIGMKTLKNVIFQDCSQVSSENQSSTLLFTSDIDCKLYIDGELKRDLVSKESIKIRVVPGEHTLKAISKKNNKIIWVANITIEEGFQKIIEIPLYSLTSMYNDEQYRLKYIAEQEQYRLKYIAEQEKELLKKQPRLNELEKMFVGSWKNIENKRDIRDEHHRVRNKDKHRDIIRSLRLYKGKENILGVYEMKFIDSSKPSIFTKLHFDAKMEEFNGDIYLVYYNQTNWLGQEDRGLRSVMIDHGFLKVIDTLNIRTTSKWISKPSWYLELRSIQPNIITLTDITTTYTFYKEN